MGTHLSAWEELWENRAESCSKITSKGYSSDLSLGVPTSPWALTLPEACSVSQSLTWCSVAVRWSKEEKKKEKKIKKPNLTKKCGAVAAEHHPSPYLSALGVHPHSMLLQGGAQPSLFGKVGHKFWVLYRTSLPIHITAHISQAYLNEETTALHPNWGIMKHLNLWFGF